MSCTPTKLNEAISQSPKCYQRDLSPVTSVTLNVPVNVCVICVHSDFNVGATESGLLHVSLKPSERKDVWLSSLQGNFKQHTEENDRAENSAVTLGSYRNLRKRGSRALLFTRFATAEGDRNENLSSMVSGKTKKNNSAT